MREDKDYNISAKELDDILSQVYMAALEAKIMAKEGEQNLPPAGMLQDILNRAHNEEETKVQQIKKVEKIKRRMSKKHLRLLILTVIIGALILGMGIIGVDSKNFIFNKAVKAVLYNY